MARKKLLARIWDFIRGIFKGLSKELKEIIPVAIDVVQQVKTVVDSPIGDLAGDLVDAITNSNMAEKFKERLRAELPELIIKMQLGNSIVNIEDVNEQLRVIFEKVKFSSDEARNHFFHGLASLVIEKLSDGELSWSDSIAISEYYYREFVKKDLKPAA